MGALFNTGGALMKLTSEQIQALKARYAEPETPNCRICGAKMSIQRAGGGSLVYGCDGRVEGDGYVFKEGRDFADKHYEQSRETVYNMGDADVMALLAERDADKALIAEQAKRIEFLKEQLALLANFNPDWDKLEAAYDSLREHMTALTAAQKRIAELEVRAVTVKLPEPLMPAQHNSGELFMTPDNVEQGGYLNRDDVLRVLWKACAAAGITLVVGE